jgi:hypothetical protein
MPKKPLIQIGQRAFLKNRCCTNAEIILHSFLITRKLPYFALESKTP